MEPTVGREIGFKRADPHNLSEEMRTTMRRSEGALAFGVKLDPLKLGMKGSIPGFPVVAGRHFFDLEILEDLKMRYLHSSPGTGTREAVVDLTDLAGASDLAVIMNWSTEEILLSISAIGSGLRHEAVGQDADVQILVGENGFTAVIPPGAEVEHPSVYVNGRRVLSATAFQIWKETIRSIEIMRSAESQEENRFEVVCTNICLAMMVTGYEAYCKSRFLEIEGEGVIPDEEAVVCKFLSQRERADDSIDEIRQAASGSGGTLLQELVERRKIDFQNFKSCNTAYRKAWGISFWQDLGILDERLKEVKRIIGYRHQIVHVSPATAILNMERHLDEPPVFANFELLEKSLGVMEEFISSLHRATLKISPPDFEETMVL